MIKRFMGKLVGKTLFYPGCITSTEIKENYLKILEYLGYDVVEITELNCCGGPVISAGYDSDFYDLAQKNKEKLQGIKRIITNCPECAFMFNTYYKIPTEHISDILYKHKDRFDKTHEEPISYHRPCHLRKAGIDAPEKLLSHIGYEVVPLPDQCCGAGGGLKRNKPEIANKAAKARLSQCRTNKIITSCPLCYQHLKENASIKVMELSEVLK
ncbi:MAG: (Fe-S)-binding protein [Candidatus Woesearchaeota archaeon]